MAILENAVGRVILSPDPGLIESLGKRHTTESALADLIDNSLDAHATVVRLRFVTNGKRLVEVHILDNGDGIGSTSINDAMTIGHKRAYPQRSLGNFGLGLKASGLSIGDTLSVWSQAIGSTPVGRRLRRAELTEDFGCDVLPIEACVATMSLREKLVGRGTGTSVVVKDLRTAYRGASDDEAQIRLSTLIETVRSHLGVVFHRWLADGRLKLEIEQCDELEVGVSLPVPVSAIDPFAYTASGYPGYPRELVATIGTRSVRLQCHIWPAKSHSTGFRMGTRSGERFQGFYVYRADRLLQIGGWPDESALKADRELARVVVSDDSIIGSLVTMNPEKDGIRFERPFIEASGSATTVDGQTTFQRYLDDAADAYRSGRRRSRRRRPTIRPDRGFAPRLRRSITTELDFVNGRDPVDIRWKPLPAGEFIDVDLTGATLWLNSKYRTLLVPTHRGLNDAPLVKALVYLLTRHVFDSDYFGTRDRDDIMLWRAILGVAAQEESALRRGRADD